MKTGDGQNNGQNGQNGNNQNNGNNDARWLKVIVDPKSRDVFYYQAVNVMANRTAVPAP